MPCTVIVSGSTTLSSSARPMRQVHDGCNAVSPSVRTQSRICSSVSTLGPGETSPPLNGSIAGWLKMRRAMRIASIHSRRSSGGGDVVEPQRRLGLRVGGGDLHRAARVGVHRPDVHLVTVPARRRRAVVADGDRQEVEHQVRVGDFVVAAHEPAALEVVRRAGSPAQEQPLGADEGSPPHLQLRLQRHRLLAGVLHVDLEVILQVPADGRQVVHDGDVQPGEMRGIADAAELQQLRRVEGPATQDDFAGRHRLGSAAPVLYSTPVARVPSNDTRCTRARVVTVRFGRCITGCR